MDEKIICLNRVATYEYYVLDTIEAGIVLDGGEVKSLRQGNCNIKDSFCMIENGELFIKNMHITPYDKSGVFNVKDAKRDRKLLVHKQERLKLKAKVEQKGLTLVPLKLYYKSALIKVQLGLCQGKHLFDKKNVQKEKDIKREKERLLSNI